MRSNLTLFYDSLTGNTTRESSPRRVSSVFLIDGVSYQTSFADILELDEYKEQIGQGRFGVVFRRRHRQSGIELAEKVVTKGATQIEKYIETEKELWKRCNNEYLVNHYGAIETPINVHLYFELLDTCFRKIYDKLKSYQQYEFPEVILAKLAYSTVSALSYLKNHHSVIHRDIKPSNILANRQGQIKLTDFGLAKTLIDSKAYTRGIGSLSYISPERISSGGENGYGSPADIWSLGILLIELSTGFHPILEQARRPNGDLVELDILIKIAELDSPRLCEGSPALCNFVNSCLYKDPSERMRCDSEEEFIMNVCGEDMVASWLKHYNLC